MSIIQKLGFPDKQDNVSYFTADECNAIKAAVNALIQEHNEDEAAGSAPVAAVNPTFYNGTTAPNAQLGVVGDSFLNTTNGYLYAKKTTGWNFLLPTRGLSAYEVWLALGNVGTQAQFLNSLKGADGTDGQDGQDGTRIFDMSYAPNPDESGNDGDQWYHSISQSSYDRYVNQNGRWRLAFRMGQPVASTTPGSGFVPTTTGDGTKFLNDKGQYVTVTAGSGTGGTVKSVNGIAPDLNGNVTISTSGGGSATPLEQNLTSNSQFAAPSVAAVAAALNGLASTTGIKFVFGTSGNVVTGTVTQDEAGTYTAQELGNVSGYELKKNGAVVSLPVVFAVGNTYQLTITRSVIAQVAHVKLKT